VGTTASARVAPTSSASPAVTSCRAHRRRHLATRITGCQAADLWRSTNAFSAAASDSSPASNQRIPSATTAPVCLSPRVFNCHAGLRAPSERGRTIVQWRRQIRSSSVATKGQTTLVQPTVGPASYRRRQEPVHGGMCMRPSSRERRLRLSQAVQRSVGGCGCRPATRLAH